MSLTSVLNIDVFWLSNLFWWSWWHKITFLLIKWFFSLSCCFLLFNKSDIALKNKGLFFSLGGRFKVRTCKETIILVCRRWLHRFYLRILLPISILYTSLYLCTICNIVFFNNLRKLDWESFITWAFIKTPSLV